ncbi:tetratricopeptide repeat protein [Roseofilum sp. Belize Diploria]|uniref:tetratricopeptide repeat protein n=2 Tax=unclassified Roseofilum TaxID=2620099 RepID=UPI001B190F55|nr:tetratricopeptide repeat protein [Roseofilum sp. Belize Diploria]MBP0008207.1 tetratricopeptide repeat protein [Roseofilum sp. Belize Diploria]
MVLLAIAWIYSLNAVLGYWVLPRYLLLGGNLCQGALAPLGLSVAAVVGGMIANDAIPQYMENLTVRLRDSRGQLDNHDLAKAVGLAIGLLIQARVEAGTYKSSKQELVSLAKCAVKHWKTVAQELKAMENDKFDPIQGDRVLGWFSQALGSEPVQVLTEADWLELLEELRVYAHVQLGENVLKQLAIDLRDKFAFALREVLKADCSEGGKAFGGLVISLLGAIHAGLQEVQVPQESREEVNQALAKLGELQQELARSEAENQARFRQLSAQLGVGIEVILGEIDRTQEILNRLRGWLGGQFEQVLAGQREILAGQNRLGITLTQEIQESEGRIIGFLQQEGKPQKSTGVGAVGDTVPRTTHWQGRAKELATVYGWLQDQDRKLGIILGIAGMGKSSLVAKVYREHEAFSGKYWAELGERPKFASLARRVLQELVGIDREIVEKTPDAQVLELLINRLQKQNYLLVLDNFESVLADGEYTEFLQGWLDCCAQTEILVTTQQEPDLVWVEPNILPLSGLSKREGAQLLQALGIGGTVEELEAYAEKVNGHPLTLRLVAGMLQEERGNEATLADLEQLQVVDVRQLLADERIRGRHRRETVQLLVVLDRSFSLLSSVWQERLLRLTVLRQGFDAALVSAMVGAEVKEKELRKLAERGVLVKAEGRYQFQPFIWEYLQYRAGDVREAHERAVEVYDSRCQMPEDWKTATVEDVQDYVELFYHLCQLGEYVQAFDVIRNNPGDYKKSVSEFLDIRGYNALRIELYLQLVPHLSNEQDWRYTASLTSLGNAYRSGIATSLMNLGGTYYYQGDYERALSFHQQSLEIQQQIGDRSGIATSLMNLGGTYYYQGDYERALSYTQQSLKIKREIGDRSGIASSFNNLGLAYNSQGDYESAISFHQQCLEIQQQIGDRSGIASSLGNLGSAYHSQGDYEAALSFYQQSLEIKQEIGDRSGERRVLNNLGLLCYYLEQYEEGIDYLQQALVIVKNIGEIAGEGKGLDTLGKLLIQLERYSEAEESLQTALTLSTRVNDVYNQAHVHQNFAVLYQKLGNLDLARSHCQQALALATQLGIPLVEECRSLNEQLTNEQ